MKETRKNLSGGRYYVSSKMNAEISNFLQILKIKKLET